MTVPLIRTPGAYPDISAEDYHRNADLLDGPSLSSSGAKTILARSPYHFWFDSPLNPNRPAHSDEAHFSVGRASHDVVLLEDRWQDHYHVLPENYRAPSRRTVNFTEDQLAAIAAAEAGKTILRAADAEIVLVMARALRRSKLGMALLTNGVTEETLVWRDPKTKIWLRARPDFRPNTLLTKRSTMAVADLKFVAPTHATPKGFSRAIDSFGYHQSAAFYADGIKAVYGHYPTNWVHIVVEKEPPHAVSIYELPQEDIERGRWMNRRAIDMFAQCLESGVWPGFGDPREDGTVQQVGLPTYARMKIDDWLERAGDAGAWSAAA